MKPIPKPEAEFQSGRLRTAGGHVHVGGTGLVQDIWSVQYFIKMLDLFLAVPSLYIDKDPTSAARRKIYGDLGSHRAKEYGFEYRVLGNFWLSSPKLVGLIYDICEWTTNFVNDGGHLQFWSKDENIFRERIRGDRNVETAFTCSKYSKNRLQEAIKNSDLTIGSEFMSLIKEYMPMSLVKDIMAASNDKQHDFYEEWAL